LRVHLFPAIVSPFMLAGHSWGWALAVPHG
jgi:hypothetical protein